MNQSFATSRSPSDITRLIDDNGDIRGAEVEAHRIAALVGGDMSIEEVLRDYPNLEPGQIEAAVRYAEANPRPGSPFPTRTAKSALRHGGGGGLAAAFAAARDEDGA